MPSLGVLVVSLSSYSSRVPVCFFMYYYLCEWCPPKVDGAAGVVAVVMVVVLFFFVLWVPSWFRSPYVFLFFCSVLVLASGIIPPYSFPQASVFPSYAHAVSHAGTDPDPAPPDSQLLSLSAQGGNSGVYSQGISSVPFPMSTAIEAASFFSLFTSAMAVPSAQLCLVTFSAELWVVQ